VVLTARFLLGLFSDPEYGGDVPPKRRLTVNGLYSVISSLGRLIGILLEYTVSRSRRHVGHASLGWSTIFVYYPHLSVVSSTRADLFRVHKAEAD
jgi:hypothetical protein